MGSRLLDWGRHARDAPRAVARQDLWLRWARNVIAQMGDGTGTLTIDGKLQDDATFKQCQVMVTLAELLAEKDEDLKKAYGL